MNWIFLRLQFNVTTKVWCYILLKIRRWVGVGKMRGSVFQTYFCVKNNWDAHWPTSRYSTDSSDVIKIPQNFEDNPRVCHIAKSAQKYWDQAVSYSFGPKNFTKWKKFKKFSDLLSHQASRSFTLWLTNSDFSPIT